MADKKRGRDPKKDEPAVEVNFGGLSLGGLFQGLTNLVGSLEDLAKKGEALKKEGTFSTTGPRGKPLRGMYGFSIRTLRDGESVVQTFGNIKPTPRGPEVQDVREPLVDVYEEKGEVVVLAELPGVEQNQIRWELKGDVLKLEAGSADRKYGKEVVLPRAVQSTPSREAFKNGVLELRFSPAP